ncbi:MAG: DUF4405 domain-containing protein [Selenomonadaceae bacterium]|nr:DUF4405 domain-containing protein [Selenomonadaceae bacterium]
MKRFLLDMGLLVLILSVMGFHFFPQVLHEVIGLILLSVVVWHLLLNRRWFASFLRGKWGKLRMLQTLAGILLVLSCLTAILTGIIISNHIFSELWIGVALHRSIFIHQLHIASAYLMVILGGMHIGRHWPELWQRIKNLPLLGALEARPHIRFWALVLISWAGCAASRLDHVGDRLALKHIFATPAMQLPVIGYFLLLLCLMGLYATIFYYAQKKLQKTHGGEAE